MSLLIDHVVVPLSPPRFERIQSSEVYKVSVANLMAKRVNPYGHRGSYIEYIEVKPSNKFYSDWLENNVEGSVMFIAVRLPGEPEDGEFEVVDGVLPFEKLTHQGEELIFGIKDTSFPIQHSFKCFVGSPYYIENFQNLVFFKSNKVRISFKIPSNYYFQVRICHQLYLQGV